MITLFLGTDNPAKKQHIKLLAAQRGAEIQSFTDTSSLPPLGGIFEQQLFGAPKVVVLDHIWKDLDPEQVLENFADDKLAMVCIVEDSLDKRKKANQEFQKDKRVKVVQFDSPIGTHSTDEWILKYGSERDLKIESAASVALTRALLTDEDSALDVQRAQSELEKLKQFANGKPITTDMVADLIVPSLGVDIFELLNAIATKNKKLALGMLQNFFDTETADEKTNAIKVVALLSDQFRNILIALDAGDRRIPDESVLKMTGWKSGRLFIMKKLARNFNAKQVQQVLAKLENLDREMKTGSMPPHVVLDLIIADM